MNASAKYVLILVISAIGVSSQILLKTGVRSFGSMELGGFISKILVVLTQPVVLFALSCYGFGFLVYLFLLSKMDVTSVYPICTSLTYAGITFFGWAVFKEPQSWPKISGIVLIIVGIFLIDHFG